MNVLKKVLDSTSKLIGTLYCRWQDEKEYEDIKDYGVPIKAAIKDIKSVKTVTMTKSPFGFKFTCVDGSKYRCFVKGEQYIGESVT